MLTPTSLQLAASFVAFAGGLVVCVMIFLAPKKTTKKIAKRAKTPSYQYPDADEIIGRLTKK